MKTKHLFISLLSLFSLALTACSIHSTTEIKADGSGKIKVRFALTEEDIAAIEEEEGEDFEDSLLAGSGDTDMRNACEELANESQFSSDATAEYSESGGEFSCEISMTFADLDELIEIYEDMLLGRAIGVRMTADGELNYSIDLNSSDFTHDLYGVTEVEYLWIVTAPGTIEDHNADDKSGRTLTWDLNASDFDSIEFDSAPGGFLSALTGSSSPLWILAFALLCLFAVALVFAGVGFYLYSHNKKKAEQA